MRIIHGRAIVLLLLAGLLTTLFLSGCATLNKDECLAADWYGIGYEDGLKGYSNQRIGDHREACAEYGVAPDPDEYLRGHERGLLEFCVPQNGYRLGLRGREIQVTCPGDMVDGFYSAYHYGKRIYWIENRLDRLTRDIKAKDDELGQVRAQLRKIDEQLVAGIPSQVEHERVTPKARKELHRKEAELEMEIAALEAEDEDEPGKRKGEDKGRKSGEDQGRKVGHEMKNAHVISGKRKELEQVRAQLITLESDTGNADASRQERIRLLQESKHLSRQEGRLEGELHFMRRQSAEMRSQVSLLKQTAPY